MDTLKKDPQVQTQNHRSAHTHAIVKQLHLHVHAVPARTICCRPVSKKVVPPQKLFAKFLLCNCIHVVSASARAILFSFSCDGITVFICLVLAGRRIPLCHRLVFQITHPGVHEHTVELAASFEQENVAVAASLGQEKCSGSR